MRESTTVGMIGLLRPTEPVDAKEGVEPRMSWEATPSSDYWRPSWQERARKRNKRKAKRRARG